MMNEAEIAEMDRQTNERLKDQIAREGNRRKAVQERVRVSVIRLGQMELGLLTFDQLVRVQQGVAAEIRRRKAAPIEPP